MLRKLKDIWNIGKTFDYFYDRVKFLDQRLLALEYPGLYALERHEEPTEETSDVAFDKKISEIIKADAHVLQGEAYVPEEWLDLEYRQWRLVSLASRYSGIGWWYVVDAGVDGIAVVLIYKDGRRIFLTAKDCLITDKLDVGGKKPSQEVEE